MGTFDTLRIAANVDEPSTSASKRRVAGSSDRRDSWSPVATTGTRESPTPGASSYKSGMSSAVVADARRTALRTRRIWGEAVRVCN